MPRLCSFCLRLIKDNQRRCLFIQWRMFDAFHMSNPESMSDSLISSVYYVNYVWPRVEGGRNAVKIYDVKNHFHRSISIISSGLQHVET